MMLPSDIALLNDQKMQVWVRKYAEDKDLFFEDFANAFGKLLELGVSRNKI
jgi:cytochrome c peroxidase